MMAVSFGDGFIGWGKRKIPASVRKFSEMLPVLMSPGAEPQPEPDTPTYYMYREVERLGNIRYDITRIPSLPICGEFNKTFGHVHPKNAKGTGWAEAYEVLGGTAHFILQKVGQMGVSDAVLLSARAGESFLVPPGYGHVTINPGKKELVMGNLVSDSFKADYSMFAQMKGACFYETLAGRLVKNRNYGDGFEIRKVGAAEFSSSFGVYAPFESCDLLTASKKKGSLDFLEKPELFY